MTRVGVLAAQGAFAEHIAVLRAIGVETRELRLPHQLEGLDGLIIPGGESTTIGKLVVAYGLLEPLRRSILGGLPVFGTCAGMILLARDLGAYVQPHLDALDIAVERNAFGSQVDSFETELVVPVLGGGPFHAVFIRAPIVERVGPGVEVLAILPGGRIVAVQQGSVLATAFHPELTGDRRFHRYFLDMIEKRNDPIRPAHRSAGAGVLQ